jgi:hypothetical protein
VPLETFRSLPGAVNLGEGLVDSLVSTLKKLEEKALSKRLPTRCVEDSEGCCSDDPKAQERLQSKIGLRGATQTS